MTWIPGQDDAVARAETGREVSVVVLSAHRWPRWAAERQAELYGLAGAHICPAFQVIVRRHRLWWLVELRVFVTD